jgi:uncharacterized protein
MNLPELARKTLEAHFQNKKFEPDEATKKKYSKEQACFVTLTKSGDLRGCIGSLEAHQILWKDVQERAVDAALNDSRFLQLTKDELKKIKIEVSILSLPKKLEFKSPDDLLNKISHKMGLILKKGFYSSTFLPQVWEEISDKKEFLEHLSLKAGLSKDSWKTSEFWFYTVDAEKEK